MKTRSRFVLCCAAAVASGTAVAVPIHPGDVVNLSGTTSAAEPWLAGPSADAGHLIPFTVLDNGGNAVFTGQFTSEPSRSDTFGTIRVRYRVRHFEGVVGGRRVVRVEIFGYAGLQTNVEFRTDGTGDIGPNLASRVHTTGDQISFIFANPAFTPDLESHSFFIHTNATAFTETGFARIVLNTGESVVVFGAHLPTLSACPTDTNADGVVNFADLNAVLSAFGDECP